MRNRKLIFLDNVLEYELDIQDDTYTLYFSEGQQWNSDTRGTIACQVIDDGNSLKITQEAPVKKKNSFDYSEASYLYIILREMYRDYNYEVGEKSVF